MVNLLINPPSGWNRWIYASTTFGVENETVYMPDADFPVLYTPSSAFWMRSIITHCAIPWQNSLDPFSLFLLGGGSTGTIIGSVSGLSVVGNVADIFTAGGSFGLFPKRQGGPGPRLGFNIGTAFKQQIYVRFDIQNTFGTVSLLGYAVELMENSRFKRYYVYEGQLLDYIVEGDEHLLRLDIDKSTIPDGFSPTGSIKVVKPSGTILTMSISGIKENWDLIISSPSTSEVPETGDYYVLDKPWIIEDPALLSGIILATENDNPSSPNSGFDFHLSEKNKPYLEGKFLGAYVWSPLDDTSTGTASTTTTTSIVSQPPAGSNMRDSATFTWAFLGFGNSDESETYKNDTRYKETLLEEPDSSSGVTVHSKRQDASSSDYSDIQSDTNTEYIRVELGQGGYYTRNNWQASGLKGNYIRVGSDVFRILDHVEFNIVDVSILSVDGTTRFDPKSNQDYSILNQYAWMINENYMQSIADSSSRGIFEGTVQSITGTKVVVDVFGDPEVITSSRGEISLEERYKDGVVTSSSVLDAFNRFQDWRLVNENSEYIVDSTTGITFAAPASGESNYLMTVNLEGAPPDLAVDDEVYISFDSTFETYGNFSKKPIGLTLSAAGGADGDVPPFLVSNVLCLDGDYFSSPYVIDVPLNARFGVCDGYLFGIEGNGTASRRDAQLSFITTPRSARGIASLYHILRQEDWIFYEEPVLQKIFIRRGSDNFKELPMKSAVIIGEPESNESASGGSSVALNTAKEYVSRIFFKPADNTGAGGTGIVFGLGNDASIYGFYISGDGATDLGMLTRKGLSPDEQETLSDAWRNEGFSVSPPYIYKRDYYAQLDKQQMDIINPTSINNIKILDGEIGTSVSVSDVTVQYINENQLLSEVGYFDAIRKSDGEILFLYGTSAARNLTVDGNRNNSSSDGNAWSNQNAVFIVGSPNDDFSWSAAGSYGDEDTKYALMVMNSVDYLASIYNPLNETLLILSRCFQGNSFYIGGFIVPVHNLYNEDATVLAEPDSDNDMDFLWRHPFLEDSFISDDDTFWTESGNIMNDGISFVPGSDRYVSDHFIRIMGGASTGSQIENSAEFGVISTSILPDGTYMILYDTEFGVRALFSLDDGYNWVSSSVSWAPNGRSAILAREYLVYITSEGVEAVQTDYAHFYIARDLAAGISTPGTEEDLQDSLAQLEHALIGSGVIEPQRLSGYVSRDGTVKVFFYDQNQLLKCIESTKGSFEWAVTNNF